MPAINFCLNVREVIEVLQDVSTALIGEFNLKNLLQKIVESFKKISCARACSIFLVDEERNMLVEEASIGFEKISKKPLEYSLNVKPDQPKIGLTAWIALNMKPLSIKSHDGFIKNFAWSRKHENYVDKSGTLFNSFYGVPLIIRDKKIGKNKVIGVIKAIDRKENSIHPFSFFSTEEEQILEIVANFVALSIKNAGLYRVLCNKEKEYEIENQSKMITHSIQVIFSKLQGKFELKEILDEIVTSFKEISEATSCSIFLKDSDGCRIIMKAAVGYNNELIDKAEYDLSVDANAHGIGLTAYVVLTGKTIRAKNREELKSYSAWAGKYDHYLYGQDRCCVSFIGIPLKVGDEIIGCIKAENKKSDGYYKEGFTDLETQALTVLATISAITVRNAQLSKEVERHRENRLVNLYEYGALLQEQRDKDKLINIFFTTLTHSQGIGINRVIYFEYKQNTNQLIGKKALGPRNRSDSEKMRIEMGESHSFTIKDAILNLEKGKMGLSQVLNDFIVNKVIDLDKYSTLRDVADKEEIYFQYDCKATDFSREIAEFLKEIEADNILLIGLGKSKKRYDFVFCDNIYNQSQFSQVREFVKIFSKQMVMALEKIYNEDVKKDVEKKVWQESARETAHSLGNIFTVISPYISDVKNAINGPDFKSSVYDFIKKIETKIKEASNLAERLKIFSIAEEISPSKYDIVYIIKYINDFLQENASVEFNAGVYNQKAISHIQLDLNAMGERVLSNLLSNTINANKDNRRPKIRISFKELSFSELTKQNLPSKGKYLAFIYEDNCGGISNEKKEKIFERFYTTRGIKEKGTGLGLAIARKTVESHDGKIFEDGIYGKGARFNIILPIYVAEE